MIPSLIPRRILFGNPERTNYQISPDGETISWVAPAEGVLNLFLAPRREPDAARQLTEDAGRGIVQYAWTPDGNFIVYAKDADGDENTHLYALDLRTGGVRDLTPFEGVKAIHLGTSRRVRDRILVAMNDRDARYHDYWTVDPASGERTPVAENPGYAGFVVDDGFRAVLAIEPQSDGGVLLHRNAEGVETPWGDDWQPWLAIPPEDARTTQPLYLSPKGDTLYLLDSRGRNTAALCTISLSTGASCEIAHDPRADIGEVVPDLDTREILAYGVDHERRTLHVIDPRGADLDWLGRLGLRDPFVADRSDNDRVWIVGTYSDVAPSLFYVVDRDERTLSPLPPGRPELATAPLRPMQPHQIPTRDGLSLVSYVTLPDDATAAGKVPWSSASMADRRPGIISGAAASTSGSPTGATRL